ncbi:fatty acyl-CoA reductase 1-like [Chrysoperla carnea]|uniref:fatty acyl-CoA reductase 1-like n=1 Tax=Chrysoperla carnea TaxID=189513 RepID=UPI001D0745F4|nr:fatty acyl-CoA reductase 1-like [Chrysoperla carnea]
MIDNKNDIFKDNNRVKSKKKVFVENVTLSQLSKDVPSIREFYADQNILVTGGTGFMGKVLIEKLLRSCPKIKGIYLLMRSKKNYTDEQRLNKIFNIPLFDKLKEECPESLSKVKIIKGDITELEYGLSDSDLEFIINEINIVFHAAASVRFDDSLKDAILINTRGTNELLKILKQMKNLKVYLHTSTTYCNIDKDVDAIEEKVYKATTNWETMIKAAETMDKNVLNYLEQKILNKYPNTYTFSKNLAEELVSENCGDIPTVIFRPTVVCCAENEPIPGWIDNFNGPVGLIAGGQVGIIHVVYINGEKKVDWVPVDRAIKGMITSAWYKALEQTERNKCLVINSSTSDFIQFNNSVLFDPGTEIAKRNPPNQLLWYPFCFHTSNKYLYWFYFVTLHLIPAIFLSVLLKISNQRLKLFKLYRRIYFANMKLAPFTLNEFKFKNDNFKSLQAILKPEDVDKFSVDYSGVVVLDHFELQIDGIIRYLLKDKNYSKDTFDKRVFNLKIKFFLHVAVISLLLIGSMFVLNRYVGKFVYKRYF